MKIRFASLIVAFALLIPMATLSFAAQPELVATAQEAAEPEEGSQAEPQTESQAESDAIFYLDGAPLEDVAATSVDGSYYVALRSILPLLDGSAVVEEGGGTAAVTAQAAVVAEEGGASAVVEVLDTLNLSVVAGQEYVTANGRCLYLAGGPVSVDGMLAIPVRMLCTILNLGVWYDDANGRVYLSRSAEPGYLTDGDDFYDADDLYWLSRIIYSESGNQSLSGQIAVGNVVLNRVRSSKFPNSVYGVIFQKNQFSPAASGAIYCTPSAGSVAAAKLALEGAVVLSNALFFNRAGLVCYASRNRTYIATIGEHAFYA